MLGKVISLWVALIMRLHFYVRTTPKYEQRAFVILRDDRGGGSNALTSHNNELFEKI